ncbi:MAG: hypothetical protein OEM67_03880, partial [Thermoleophilia bacterium]|nr:hypothetical protein [Thermoleophilia bacterium]
MSSTTGLIFSYIIGLIFLIGGLVFLLFLDDNRFLFGVPYTLVGLLIVVGIHMSLRRRKRAPAEGDVRG